MVGQLSRINCGTAGKDNLVTIDSSTFRIVCVASSGEFFAETTATFDTFNTRFYSNMFTYPQDLLPSSALPTSHPC
jgi:hypothetical protein